LNSQLARADVENDVHHFVGKQHQIVGQVKKPSLIIIINELSEKIHPAKRINNIDYIDY
jgi:hypothetical protein